MQTLKFEMAVAGIALFALGGFVATRPSSAVAAVEPVAVRAFSDADFDRFDRGFMIGDQPCKVGMERYKICFGTSPIEASLHNGMVIAPEVPLVTAEFRVIVETDLKDDSLRTVRFGQTLVLVDPETRVVVDMMRLTAPDISATRTQAASAG